MIDSSPLPTLAEITEARAMLGDSVMTTPSIEWKSQKKDDLLGKDTEVVIKLELFQPGGSFKLRGALLNIRLLTPEQLQRGVTAVSAGNHAIAVAMAAQVAGTHAKVVMPQSANAGRITKCERLGAEIVLMPDVGAAFTEAERIQQEEGRTFIHPFEGATTALGTATVGLELWQQANHLDAAILPIGGGGLAAGMAAALSQCSTEIELFGVEPFGANSMFKSFQSGKPERIASVDTIADSLGAPFSLPYSFGVCQQTITEIALIHDDEMKNTMRLMFEEFKLAAEPAGASSMAALLGPLRERLAGQRVGIIVCGSNIDSKSFFSLIAET